MVDRAAEDDGEASEWGRIDNYITPPRRRGLRPRKARVGSCKDGGGVGTRIGRARMIEGRSQQCGVAMVIGHSFLYYGVSHFQFVEQLVMWWLR